MSSFPQSAEDLLTAIRSAAQRSPRSILTFAEFRRLTGIPDSQVKKYFDGWKDACRHARVTCGEASPRNITPRYSRGKEHALSEVKRIAGLLGVTTLSKSQFDAQCPEVKSLTVARLWNGWDSALEAAELQRDPRWHDEIPLADLAADFLGAVCELGRVPSVHQLCRRSSHAKNSFTRKFGGYPNFKVAAIRHLLSVGRIPDDLRPLLAAHLDALTSENKREPAPSIPPHARGRHSGFRAFAFVPTYEAEVSSIFSCVAEELGFEIVAQRPAFPDCETRRMTDRRRKRFEKCLIEFEFRSSDYRKHAHPTRGCDLIVCWEHDWDACPVNVLELRSAIRKLPGWK